MFQTVKFLDESRRDENPPVLEVLQDEQKKQKEGQD